MKSQPAESTTIAKRRTKIILAFITVLIAGFLTLRMTQKEEDRAKALAPAPPIAAVKGDASGSRTPLAVRKQIYVLATQAHVGATKYADRISPVSKPITSASKDALLKNSDIYDREFARLAKPIERRFGVTEVDIDIIMEEGGVNRWPTN